MKAAGADLIVALAHGGIDMATAYSPSMENGAGYLSQVPGIELEKGLIYAQQGDIAINNAADLYLYPNTLQVVRVSGDIVLQAPDASRDVLIGYIKQNPTLDLATYGLDRSWRFKQLGALAGPVVFSSVPGTLAMAAAHGVANVSVHDATPDPVTQLSRYAVDLSL